MADAEIDTLLSGSPVPAAILAYHRVAGRHWLNANHKTWLPLGKFEPAGDHTIFMDENQLVVRWGIRTCDMNVDNPTVFQMQSVDGRNEWHSLGQPFSEFIIAMWHWVLTGSQLPS